MTCTLDHDEVEIIVIRKKNKNIYFRVKEDLKLYITCPIYVREKELTRLINDNISNIEKMYLKQKEKKLPINTRYYLGKKYQIVYDENNSNIIVNDQENIIYCPSEEELDKFFLDECDRVFKEEVDKCKQCFRKLPEFTLKKRLMRTRWGVCNRRLFTITLNVSLIEKEIDLIDYVIIHEMCHFYEGNHGKGFWNLVGQAYPKYKEARKKLKE